MHSNGIKGVYLRSLALLFKLRISSIEELIDAGITLLYELYGYKRKGLESRQKFDANSTIT